MLQRSRVLSGNALKLIAALSMLIDHMGVILFPRVAVLRVIGRLAFPIFAFMIAEGCRYTRNKARYFFTVFGVGAACQSVLFLYNRSPEVNVLLTFSLSVLLIYAFQWLKEEVFSATPRTGVLWGRALLLGALVCGTGILALCVDLDYGAEGALLPLFAALLHPPRHTPATHLHALDEPRLHALCMLPGLLLLAISDGGIQFYSFFSLPLLCLYSGKRGRWKMKYFFYVFYPAHLLLLQVIAWIFL